MVGLLKVHPLGMVQDGEDLEAWNRQDAARRPSTPPTSILPALPRPLESQPTTSGATST